MLSMCAGIALCFLAFYFTTIFYCDTSDELKYGLSHFLRIRFYDY